MTKKNKTIRWEESVDALAVRLAAERGITTQKGGVSELLSQLVLEEAKDPRLHLEEPTSGYKTHIAKSQELSDEILKKSRKAGR